MIVTPNHLHAPIATAFLEAGIDVICDKPLSTTLAEAEALVALTARAAAQVPGDAQQHRLRDGPAGARDGGGGRARHGWSPCMRAYIQDWLTKPIDADGQKQAEWRTDPARAGQSAVLADIGVHAFNLACFISRPRGGGGRGRSVHRRARAAGSTTMRNVLVRWTGGARGTILASQTSPGHYNDLSVRLYGDKAGLEWSGSRPEELRFSPYGEEARTLVRGGHGAFGESQPRVAHAGGASGRLYRGLRQPLPRRRRDHPRATAAAGRSTRTRAAPGARRGGRRARREVRRGGGGLEPGRRSLDGGAVRLRAQALASKASTSRLACARIQPLTVRTTLPFESWLSVK